MNRPISGMRSVALTGNIASGKSAVADMLAQRGATIIDADELSREAVEPGTPALAAIVKRWGPGVLAKDGTLDRAALRKTVFNDRSELDALNEIVHPEVARLREAEISAARARGDRIVVSVIPLLFERHLADNFDYIVLVDAPRPMRLDRIVRDRGLEEAEAMDMIASQMPAELKKARADWVIENAGTMEQLEREVDRLWESLAGDGALTASNAP
ncbi:MAG TPA: dephospho-CoA kinase [Gemmatimonadaceae bacterium]|nr:dephospho-CoA kinase [Gemmatimonadaceae bacterium]